MQTPHSLLDRMRDPSDRPAWSRFVELFVPLVSRWVRQWGERDSDDIVQEVFSRLLTVMPTFEYREGGSFHAWLWTVSRNAFLQSRRRMQAVPLDAVAEPAAPAEPDGEEEAGYREYLLGRAMVAVESDFEPTTWAAFRGFVLEGSPAAEVATGLGISANAVYLARARVLTRLRQELSGLLADL